MEPTVEVAFTNSMIQEFERAKIGRVTDSNQAEVLVEGVIDSINVIGQNPYSTSDDEKGRPMGAVLNSQYAIQIVAHVTLKRNSDKSVLWSGEFRRDKTFNAAQVFSAGVNTVNPLYNFSARRQNIELLASEMMSEAHDRMTENF